MSESADSSPISGESAAPIPLHVAELLIRSGWESMDYRPVVVAAIRDKAGRALLVQSAKHTDEWGFIQGGIDLDEELYDAYLREASEEAGIPTEDLEIGDLTDIVDSDIPPGHSDRRGFTKGKRYFVVQATYVGSGNLTLDPSELNGVVWVEPYKAGEYLMHKRPEKRQLIERALSH